MTYATTALLFLAGACLVAVLCLLPTWPPSTRWRGAVGLVALTLAALTAVFDSVMIAADLFRYDESALSGVRVLLTPVEDFAWPLAAAVLLPSLWVGLGRRRSRGPQGGATAATGAEASDGPTGRAGEGR